MVKASSASLISAMPAGAVSEIRRPEIKRTGGIRPALVDYPGACSVLAEKKPCTSLVLCARMRDYDPEGGLGRAQGTGRERKPLKSQWENLGRKSTKGNGS